MVLLRSLNELVRVISCLTHEESDKMVGRRNSLSGSTVLTEYLSASVACYMDRDSTPQTWAVDETLKD